MDVERYLQCTTTLLTLSESICGITELSNSRVYTKSSGPVFREYALILRNPVDNFLRTPYIAQLHEMGVRDIDVMRKHIEYCSKSDLSSALGKHLIHICLTLDHSGKVEYSDGILMIPRSTRRDEIRMHDKMGHRPFVMLSRMQITRDLSACFSARSAAGLRCMHPTV